MLKYWLSNKMRLSHKFVALSSRLPHEICWQFASVPHMLPCTYIAKRLIHNLNKLVDPTLNVQNFVLVGRGFGSELFMHKTVTFQPNPTQSSKFSTQPNSQILSVWNPSLRHINIVWFTTATILRIIRVMLLWKLIFLCSRRVYWLSLLNPTRRLTKSMDKFSSVCTWTAINCFFRIGRRSRSSSTIHCLHGTDRGLSQLCRNVQTNCTINVPWPIFTKFGNRLE